MSRFTSPMPVFRDLLRQVCWSSRSPIACNRQGEHRKLLALPIAMRSEHFPVCWAGEQLPRVTELPPDALRYLAIGRFQRTGRAVSAIRENDGRVFPNWLELNGPGM
jgi:hypothetical protein